MTGHQSSPVKGGMGGMGSYGGGGINAILEKHRATGGLSMGNKDFMKLSKGGAAGGAARSQTGKSVNSRGTRATGRSGSRRSSKKDEFDWEEMGIEELDVMIEGHEREVIEAEKLKKKINSKKVMTAQQKAKEIAPLEE